MYCFKSFRPGSAALVVVCGAVLASCTDEHPVDLRPSHSVNESPTAVELISDDEIFEDPLHLQLAKEMPEFGGFYYNAEGELEIAVTQSAKFAETRSRVRAVLPASAAREATSERVVEYSFLELARYRTALSRSLGKIPGVVSLSVKESTNRVLVGVVESEPAARTAVTKLASGLGIPDGP